MLQNAWGKVNGVKGDDIVSLRKEKKRNEITNKGQLFLSDTKTFFSKEYGWPAGMGDRK